MAGHVRASDVVARIGGSVKVSGSKSIRAPSSAAGAAQA
jgi:hypothetical protein